jgi:Eco57I restriction-modification methylase/TaqI-like C-terminal specificity domain
MKLARKQNSFDFFDNSVQPYSSMVSAALEQLSTSVATDILGAIYTREEVVDFILDLAGYTTDKPLFKLRLLEPSFGAGNFLLPVIDRLLTSWKQSHRAAAPVVMLGNAIRAIELHSTTFAATHCAVIKRLEAEGISNGVAVEIANQWLSQDDFLLLNTDGEFDFVIGNPPYVRQELIPAALLAEYRGRYITMYDRADIYVAFIERSLTLLAPGGKLGFICADRWMKNKYGGPLRSLVAENFHLKIYVDMTNTPAFQSDVIAYPAITIISNESPGPTRIASQPVIEKSSLAILSRALLSREGNNSVRELAIVPNGSEPWLLESSKQTAVIRRLELDFPNLEEAGCKVGIGVATGADKAFIGDFESMNVEPNRKLRLVTTKDIVSGVVRWLGQGVVNPFEDSGVLVDLQDYPLLKEYLEVRHEAIAARHCAKKTPSNWYRTIDRITPSIALKPKLLIPDIKGEANIVFDDSGLYPHHNLYYVTSDVWDLRALQAVLLSSVTKLFIKTYSTKMHGGFLRFQAQYLRRIRVPHWAEVSKELRLELASAATKRDMKACNKAVKKLYGLSKAELCAIEGDKQ